MVKKVEKIKKGWGHEDIIYNEEYTVKRLVIKPGCSTSLQFHNEKIETMFVHSGTGIVHLENNRDKVIAKSLKTNSFIHIKQQLIHRVENTSNIENLIIIEASTPHMDDVVRLKVFN